MSYHPALLISYAYMKVDVFEKTHREWNYRKLIIDSGAWTAHTLGKKIVLAEFIDTCHRIKAADAERLDGIFALDVIGNWKASLGNTEAMWRAGIEAIPTFHHGEPWEALTAMARDYPKIAIGGIAKAHASLKLKFAQQCFSRVWPKKIHGLGYGSEQFIKELPFHSCDASTWKVGAASFGRWKAFDRQLCVPAAKFSLRPEAERYQELERQARGRWAPIMPKIGASADNAPTVYLATEFSKQDKFWLGI